MAKRWEKRAFYRLHYEPGERYTGEFYGMPVEVFPVTSQPLEIYGYEEDSEYDEDHQYIDRVMEQGRVYGMWFSKICVAGEVGTQPKNELTEITREEFEQARQRKFQ